MTAKPDNPHVLPPDEQQRLTRDDHRYVWHPFTQHALWNEMMPQLIVAGEAEYLIDALKRMDSEELVLWLSDPLKAGLVEPSGDASAESDRGFLYVCMPVRLTN